MLKYIFLFDMRVVEWIGVRGFFIFLLGFGFRFVRGSMDEIEVEFVYMLVGF